MRKLSAGTNWQQNMIASPPNSGGDIDRYAEGINLSIGEVDLRKNTRKNQNIKAQQITTKKRAKKPALVYLYFYLLLVLQTSKVNRYQLTYTGLLHRHTVYHIYRCHGLLVVRYNDEL